jgi:hypothetical protein
VFAPVYALSYGPAGAILLAPGDAIGTVLIPERCTGSCRGVDGGDGPNLACGQCGQPVGTRIDECGYWQVVRLLPEAVQRLVGEGRAEEPLDWETLARERRSLPPVDPDGSWNMRWQAAVAEAAAHLLAASASEPLAFPEGPLTETLGRVLRGLLPKGEAAKRVALAGPGLPMAGPEARIALVPRHPQTGEAWRPTAGSAVVVPVVAEVWMHLAFHPFHDGRSRRPATGGLPAGVERDDPLPPRPWHGFEFDR